MPPNAVFLKLFDPESKECIYRRRTTKRIVCMSGIYMHSMFEGYWEKRGQGSLPASARLLAAKLAEALDAEDGDFYVVEVVDAFVTTAFDKVVAFPDDLAPLGQ